MQLYHTIYKEKYNFAYNCFKLSDEIVISLPYDVLFVFVESQGTKVRKYLKSAQKVQSIEGFKMVVCSQLWTLEGAPQTQRMWKLRALERHIPSPTGSKKQNSA
jgi:hypothetical protein